MKQRKVHIHIYTGKGKGKTSAALGLAMRAIGWGMKVCVFQFLKKGTNGESKTTNLLESLLKVVTFDQTHPMFYEKHLRGAAAESLKKRFSQDLKTVQNVILEGNYAIVILDEILNAVDQDFVTKKEVLSLINSKFGISELVLTGRGAPEWLINKADYVTEMRLIKHPYTKGLPARKGIEY
ncbi:MAG: cob(I)yrinic acid a,c-diamide adenosyltransferase [Candidatus Omnitrophota bacterium]